MADLQESIHRHGDVNPGDGSDIPWSATASFWEPRIYIVLTVTNHSVRRGTHVRRTRGGIPQLDGP
jgi:hypothetical protein